MDLRKRSWPEGLRWMIVAASSELRASVSVVARSYDASTNRLFNWHRL
jgi:transposase-like protein